MVHVIKSGEKGDGKQKYILFRAEMFFLSIASNFKLFTTTNTCMRWCACFRNSDCLGKCFHYVARLRIQPIFRHFLNMQKYSTWTDLQIILWISLFFPSRCSAQCQSLFIHEHLCNIRLSVTFLYCLFCFLFLECVICNQLLSLKGVSRATEKLIFFS